MRFKDVLSNIVTFGAYGRVQNAKKNYDSVLDELKELSKQMELRKIEINNLLLNVVEVKKRAVLSLNKINKIIKYLKGKEREFFVNKISDEKLNLDFSYVENTLNIANSVLSATKGTGAGIATGSAAYFLVGQFAAASTGTAINTLSGAAATNATLAWLGGGSIAAGGGGIAAGAAVLGGLIAIPALAVMGIFNHLSVNKQIKQIKEKEYEAFEMIDLMKKNLLAFDLIEKRSNEIGLSISKFEQVFNIEFKKVYRAIYPIPLISRLIKSLKKNFGFNYFNSKDLKQIQYIGKISTDFAKLIDTKVLLENK